MITSEVERGLQAADAEAGRDGCRKRSQFFLQERGAIVVASLVRTKNLDAQLRHNAGDRENRAGCAGTYSVEKHGSVSGQHREVGWTQFHSRGETVDVVGAILHADDVFVFAETRDGFGFDLDAGECRHAVKENRDRRYVSDGGVVGD